MAMKKKVPFERSGKDKMGDRKHGMKEGGRREEMMDAKGYKNGGKIKGKRGC
jgi:hypothetical protein